MDVLDCPVCFEPFKPPIFQCSVGHFICSSCCNKLNKCPGCSRTTFERCLGMERIVESAVVPCTYVEHGCTNKVTYFNKKSHEQACSYEPCFCPDSSCSFSGTVATLWEHFTTQHKWLSTEFKYYTPFDVRVKPGAHFLRAGDGQLFVMNMVPMEPVGHGVSLVCVQPNTSESSFGCNVAFSSFTGHARRCLTGCQRTTSASCPRLLMLVLPSFSESPLTLSCRRRPAPPRPAGIRGAADRGGFAADEAGGSSLINKDGKRGARLTPPLFKPSVALPISIKSMGSSADKKQGVTIGMDVLDCPVCYEPFKPPILQCSVGHFICSSCRMKLKKCPVCSRSNFERCFGMERVVESIVVPCSYAENGCTNKIHYFNKKIHEQTCSHGPCFCPDSTCGFSGPVATLLKHFATQHKWPSTEFKYYTPFDLRVKPGAHFLRADDGQLFVMNMVPVEPVGHGVSLVCIQPNTSESSFRCNVVFSSFTGHHQISTLESVRCSSLSDGLPKNYFCIVPKSPGGGAAVLLRITIDTKLVLEVEDEQEEEDDDDYDEDEDEDDESDDEDGN
uniref:RING-type E3 ubiquitin transferase n=1 Tax=Oryza nivara TaxID=4536 RepID=A0A0E0FFL4_ORYNI